MKKKIVLKVQLAKELQKGMNGHKKDNSEFKIPPLYWWMSEKFDGYRALFKYEMIDGKLVEYSIQEQEKDLCVLNGS